MSRKPDARNDKTQADVRAGLVRLLDTRSFESLTVRQIATEGGTSPATFFRHFRDKRDLLDSVIEQFLESVTSGTMSLLSSELSEQAAIALCEHVEGDLLTSRALLTGGASGAVHQEFLRRAVEWAGGHPPARQIDLPGALAILHPLRSIVGIISWWLSEMPEMQASEVGKLIDVLVLRPVFDYRTARPEKTIANAR